MGRRNKIQSIAINPFYRCLHTGSHPWCLARKEVMQDELIQTACWTNWRKQIFSPSNNIHSLVAFFNTNVLNSALEGTHIKGRTTQLLLNCLGGLIVNTLPWINFTNTVREISEHFWNYQVTDYILTLFSFHTMVEDDRVWRGEYQCCKNPEWNSWMYPQWLSFF